MCLFYLILDHIEKWPLCFELQYPIVTVVAPPFNNNNNNHKLTFLAYVIDKY